jgi:hypothetical protein
MTRIESSVRRADEFLEGAENILARRPDCGHQLEDSNIWFLPGHVINLGLYYTFDDNHVYFLSIGKFTPPEL